MTQEINLYMNHYNLREHTTKTPQFKRERVKQHYNLQKHTIKTSQFKRARSREAAKGKQKRRTSHTEDGSKERLLFGEAKHVSMNDLPAVLITVHVLPPFLVDVVSCEVVPQHSGLVWRKMSH